MLKNLSHAQIIFGAACGVWSLKTLQVFYEETKHYAIQERLMAGRLVEYFVGFQKIMGLKVTGFTYT